VLPVVVCSVGHEDTVKVQVIVKDRNSGSRSRWPTIKGTAILTTVPIAHAWKAVAILFNKKGKGNYETTECTEANLDVEYWSDGAFAIWIFEFGFWIFFFVSFVV
jgi:hypothetical protein